MCLILFAFQAHPDYPLVVAANRDESYGRPTLKAAFWIDQPNIYGGRDLDMGGTWMALTRNGRFAAITNFRDGDPKGVAPRSRGELSNGWLTGHGPVDAFFSEAVTHADEYAGYSMLAGDLAKKSMWCLSNRMEQKPAAQAIPPGVHGLSNHLLNTPWPKVEHGRAALQAWLANAAPERTNELFDMLADRSVAPEHALPDTGVGITREKQLGPKFVAADNHYGTRASTVILVSAQGDVYYSERSFGGRGKFLGDATQRFKLTV